MVFWGQNANRRYLPEGADEKGGHLLRFDGQPEVVDAAGFRTGKDAPFAAAPSPVPAGSGGTTIRSSG